MRPERPTINLLYNAGTTPQTYDVWMDEEILVLDSPDPFRDAALSLIARGFAPDTWLCMHRSGEIVTACVVLGAVAAGAATGAAPARGAPAAPPRGTAATRADQRRRPVGRQ